MARFARQFHAARTLQKLRESRKSETEECVARGIVVLGVGMRKWR